MRLHDVSKLSNNNSDDELKILDESELKKLQKILLMIIDDISSICVDNNIEFILIGGSAIGAMRHKGFIPWDDDVDIAMTRKDYEILKECIEKKYTGKYIIEDARNKKNFGKVIPKIRLLETTYKTILDEDIDECGIRVDIFIIENVSNNILLRNFHGLLCMFFGFALACRRIYKGRNKYSKIFNGHEFKIKCIFGFLFSFASLETWAKWTNYWYSFCKNNNSKYISIPTDGAHFFGELNFRSNICHTKKVEFEGRKLLVPKDVDSYLTRIYGNYMELPPKNKRVRSCYLEYDLGKYKNILEEEN